MKVVASAGNQDIAMVYVVEFPGGLVECVEAIQPPRTREEKWVLMISTLFGCPVACQMCDAGGHYQGKLTEEEMYAQIQYLIDQRYPEGLIPSNQFKIQFARMGEPALNPAVLDLLTSLPERVNAPGLLPSFSTIAPHELIPVKKWDFQKIAEFGERYYKTGDRKITLNFALAEDSPVDPGVLLEYFDPELFLIKVTPLNPTYQAIASGLKSYIDPEKGLESYPALQAIEEAGYRLILSIGEREENRIGSNCGQYVQKHLLENGGLTAGYTYQVVQPLADPE